MENSRAVPELLWVCAPVCPTVVHAGEVGAPVLGVAPAVWVVPVRLYAGGVALVATQVVPAAEAVHQAVNQAVHMAVHFIRDTNHQAPPIESCPCCLSLTIAVCSGHTCTPWAG